MKRVQDLGELEWLFDCGLQPVSRASAPTTTTMTTTSVRNPNPDNEQASVLMEIDISHEHHMDMSFGTEGGTGGTAEDPIELHSDTDSDSFGDDADVEDSIGLDLIKEGDSEDDGFMSVDGDVIWEPDESMTEDDSMTEDGSLEED